MRINYLFSILGACTLMVCSPQVSYGESIRVLLLSGDNNHAWQETTPLLKKVFEVSGFFMVDVTNQPDTLSYETLKRYNVVVSNWNSWPENDVRWTPEAENGLLKYVELGGGLVFFHASTSALYGWSDFKKISTSTWVKDTWHGKISHAKVKIENQEHPITKDLADFYIFDELWINAERNDDFQVLGSAINDDALEKGYENQPAIFVGTYGKGRIFHTILGHNVRAIRNTGFQTLMLRGTEWAATSKVTIPVPREMQQKDGGETFEYSWVENDTVFALYKNDQILWQFNFNTRYGKPFFNPVYVNRNRITCISPDDHRWHLGQWFSWKYINGKNYWEYEGKGYQSEGITDIKSIKLKKKSDYSAEIALKLEYHPADEVAVLTEKRIIQISAPSNDGQILMEYNMEFKALADHIDLNRTPIMGEPDGQSWGGYAGLSLRFNQDFMDEKFISSFGEDNEVNGKTGNWLYMGFRGLDGDRVGSMIMIPEGSRREGEAWYSVNTPDAPFYYFSPAYLYLKPLMLSKGERIDLKYKVLHLSGDVTGEALQEAYEQHK